MSYSYGLLAGLFAASGSFFGKLSGEKLFENSLGCHLFQVCCFAAMVAFNGAMWTFYVKALQASSSFQATVVSCATNYILSSVVGVGMFGEETGLLYWIGLTVLLFGLYLIQASEPSKKEQ